MQGTVAFFRFDVGFGAAALFEEVCDGLLEYQKIRSSRGDDGDNNLNQHASESRIKVHKNPSIWQLSIYYYILVKKRFQVKMQYPCEIRKEKQSFRAESAFPIRIVSDQNCYLELPPRPPSGRGRKTRAARRIVSILTGRRRRRNP
jgi:hypothetical protein